jgi:heme exporter protein A
VTGEPEPSRVSPSGGFPPGGAPEIPASEIHAAETPGLRVDAVWKYYGDFPALRNIQLRIEPGSTLALLGRNGAGKTTLLRIIAGLSKPSEGSVQIRFAGSEATRARDVRDEATRRRIGVLGHGISLYDELSAIENLTLFAKLYGVRNPEQQADAWLERTGLDRVRDGLVREFSRGMRQRLAVARAFIHDPEILIFDEPFTALDDRAIAVLQSLLAEAHARGRTIIMSTHQLREALELASHVAMIQRGQLVFAGERTRQMVDDTGWLYRTYGDVPDHHGGN